MPILKQLGQSGPHSKRRSRLDLTREMISAPLGDFRHTMHVGRGGEAFGDTSFLSKRQEEGAKGEREEEEEGGAGLRVLPEEEEEEEEEEEDAAGGRPPLPEGGCEGQRAAQQGAVSPPSPSSPPPAPSTGAMRAAESVLSLFQVDLGPSMLSEVLGVMEKGPSTSVQTPGTGGAETVGEAASPSVQREEEEEEEEEGQGNFTFEEEDEEIGV